MPSGGWLCKEGAEACCLLHGGVLPALLTPPVLVTLGAGGPRSAGRCCSAAASPPLGAAAAAPALRRSSSPWRSKAAISCGSFPPTGPGVGAEAATPPPASPLSNSGGAAPGAPPPAGGVKPRGVGSGGRVTLLTGGRGAPPAWRSSSSPRRNTSYTSAGSASGLAPCGPPFGLGNEGASLSTAASKPGPCPAIVAGCGSRGAPFSLPLPLASEASAPRPCPAIVAGCGNRGMPFCVPLPPAPKALEGAAWLWAVCTGWGPPLTNTFSGALCSMEASEPAAEEYPVL
mmetsp:Transcript_111481/g.310445  ORF Transcript_111481/g.310445 Transcript_111481/m.310445 type:complete len:287 (-) Transcript_111481:2074-2934(-)